jgi:hypothetical protein
MMSLPGHDGGAEPTAGMVSSRRDDAVDDEAVAVLHHDMADIAKAGRLAVGLLVEPGVGIGGALVGLVGPLLLVKVALGVATRPLRIVLAAVLATKALDPPDATDFFNTLLNRLRRCVDSLTALAGCLRGPKPSYVTNLCSRIGGGQSGLRGFSFVAAALVG